MTEASSKSVVMASNLTKPPQKFQCCNLFGRKIRKKTFKNYKKYYDPEHIAWYILMLKRKLLEIIHTLFLLARNPFLYIYHFFSPKKPLRSETTQIEPKTSTISSISDDNSSTELTDEQLEDLFSVENSVEELLIELRCPICNEFMTKNIIQCCLGHSICSTCLPKLNNKCPLCKTPFENIRNFCLENLAGSIVIPCLNWRYGCRESVSLQNWKSHVEDCDFGSFHCPMRDERLCTWRGKLCELKTHLSLKHRIRLNVINAFADSIENKPSFYYMISILNYKSKYFKMFEVHIIEDGKHFVKWVNQYIGSRTTAHDYIFTLDFEDQTNTGYKLIASCYCVPYEQLVFQKPLYSFCIDDLQLANFRVGPKGYKYSVRVRHKSDLESEEKVIRM